MSDDTDKILLAHLTDEEKISNLARLCRHRGQCMEDDADKLVLYQKFDANNKCIIKNLEQQIQILEGIPVWTRWLVAINDWAKS